MTWDEAGDETIIELFNLNFFNFFLLIIFFLVWKYSIHFFSFLEATDTAGRSVVIIIKQFFRDIMGLLGLILRFIILVFRLNVYDNLDDILDSYYIFFIDYDDMDYYNEWLFGSIFYTFFFSDYNSDSSILLENELDWSFDIYSLFFIIWGKIAFFFIFIIEEFARVFLALYISLLISFEVHAVNSSYNELKA